MKTKLIKTTLLTCAVMSFSLLCACGESNDHRIKPSDMTSGTQAAQPTESALQTESSLPTDESAAGTETTAPEENAEPSYSVHLVCAGDNLIHNYIYDEARERAGGNGYDFSFVYEKALKYFDDADIAILNQETIVTDEFEPSSYPGFCSPGAVGDYVVDEIGFNVISMANNHILDMGEEGLVSTLDYWDTRHPEVIRYGAYRDTADMENIRTMEVNGITFAFLGYMQHTNGIEHTGALGTRLVYLNELDTIEQQIRKADEIADVVVVSPHFGVEVQSELNEDQQYCTSLFTQWGADIIIGTQPHTIQECNWYEKPDGSKAFVYYCLGNFVSAMSNKLAWIGGIGDLYVEMDPETREITIKDPKIIPIISHYGEDYSNVQIIPYAEYTEELAQSHGYEPLSMDYIDDVLKHVPQEFLSIE